MRVRRDVAVTTIGVAYGRLLASVNLYRVTILFTLLTGVRSAVPSFLCATRWRLPRRFLLLMKAIDV